MTVTRYAVIHHLIIPYGLSLMSCKIFQVLKEGLDGPVVVTVRKKEMQNGPFDSKFTAFDLNSKQISINDVVKISKGPSEV